MIGDKLMQAPETLEASYDILELFGIEGVHQNSKIDVAGRLVALNNEVYERLQNIEKHFDEGIDRIEATIDKHMKRLREI